MSAILVLISLNLEPFFCDSSIIGCNIFTQSMGTLESGLGGASFIAFKLALLILFLKFSTSLGVNTPSLFLKLSAASDNNKPISLFVSSSLNISVGSPNASNFSKSAIVSANCLFLTSKSFGLSSGILNTPLNASSTFGSGVGSIFLDGLSGGAIASHNFLKSSNVT